MDYAADVSVGMNSIEGWEFKTKLVLDKELGNSFPLALYMEKPAAFGQNANKLLLLACKKAPPPGARDVAPWRLPAAQVVRRLGHRPEPQETDVAGLFHSL